MNTKRCSACKRDLSVESFSKKRSTPDGLQYECKGCVRSYKKKHREANRERLRLESRQRYAENRLMILAQSKQHYQEHKTERNAYRKTWAEKNHDKQRAYNKTHYERSRSQYAEYRAEWNAAHPLEREAHRIVRKALQSGAIKRPDNCSRCGQAKKLEAHHGDYTKPLEVEWLCRSCHKLTHKTTGDHLAEEARTVLD